MKIPVIELRPTQFAVGMKEVALKVAKLQEMNEKRRDAYLEEHPIPVVLGPQGEAFMIDHHHLARACWEAGIKKVMTEKKADLSHLKPEDYWKEMIRARWAYLYDQLGNGPHEPFKLPENVRCLADDPYRSLAWAVRDAGGFEKKPDEMFCEFHWAEFFRKKIRLDPGEASFKKALTHALQVARSPEAAKLPGFIHKA